MLKIFKMFKNYKKGFTLLELLVVVLIIGILASIALPQYEMAVTKAKISSILPIMRRWKDALTEYKLQHGSYCKVETDGECEEKPDGADLGVNWPSDWKNGNDEDCGDSNLCENDTWICTINNWAADGSISCEYKKGNGSFLIVMLQADGYTGFCYDENGQKALGKTLCYPLDDYPEKICKSIGKFVCESDYNIYQIGN